MDADVTVVGAGPAGLMLAGELALRGVSVVVLERREAPDQTIRAGSVNVPTAEAFDRRGLLPGLLDAQAANLAAFSKFTGGGAAKPPPKFAGHFAGMFLSADQFDDADPAFAGRGPAGDVGFVNQQQVEAVLGAWIAQLGVEVRRGVEMTGFSASTERVTVQIGGQEMHTRWLVGCDGGRSAVRKQAGFDFPGTDPEMTAYQAVVDLDGEEPAKGWHTTPAGIYAYGPTPGRILTVEFGGSPVDRDTPVTAAELEASLRTVTGADVRITGVRSATRFTDNARQAATYRQGRVLLAGDAAHVHSPFGGQGLNLSVGDAVNLGWKLAAVVRGAATEDLLDSYTAERHPIGAWVLDWTRAQIAIMRPDPYARAIRSVVGDLLGTVDATTYFTKQISGVTHRYDLGSEHPLVGRSAPDLVLADGSRLNEHLHTGAGLLVDLGGLPAGIDTRSLPTTRGTDGDLPGLLVRPDGVVAWAGGDDDLHVAVERWFGTSA